MPHAGFSHWVTTLDSSALLVVELVGVSPTHSTAVGHIQVSVGMARSLASQKRQIVLRPKNERRIVSDLVEFKIGAGGICMKYYREMVNSIMNFFASGKKQ